MLDSDKYWVGQKVRSGLSIRCYRKTQMNFLAKPVLGVKQSREE